MKNIRDVSKNCKWCQKHFRDLYVYVHHARWCEKNPAIGEIKQFETICQECQNKFYILEHENKFEKTKSKFRFCSKVCSSKYSQRFLQKKKLKCNACQEIGEADIRKKEEKFICSSCIEKRKEEIRLKKTRAKVYKECKRHGITEFCNGRADGATKCKKCAMGGTARKRKATKELCVKMFGGSCIVCDYNRSYQALEFHHVNPEKKEFGISERSYSPYNILKLKEELKKCIIVCSNCHKEIEAKIIDVTSEILERQKDRCYPELEMNF